MKKIKRFAKGISLALAAGVIIGCQPAGNPPEAPLVFDKLNIEKETISLGIGEEKTLNVEVKANKDTYDEKIAWTSSDETVVTVSANGVVKGIGPGSAVVTAKIGELTDTIAVTVNDNEPTYTFLGLTKKKSFVTSKTNKGEQTNKEEEFKELNKPYVVGTENPFIVLPNLTIVDDDFDDYDNETDSINKWNHDFKYTVSKIVDGNKNAAPAGDYSIVSNREGKIKFAESAIGNKYEIKVTAGGLSEAVESRASASVSYEVSVVKGYNVYTAKELSYIDQRHGDGPDAQDWKTGDVAGFRPMWDAFKQANGLRTDYNPDCLILQDNIKVTKDDIPSTFFYTAEELKNANDAKAVGSMKDSCELYLYMGLDQNSANQFDYNMEKSLKLYGNYFTIDFSTFPLVKRAWGEKTEEGKVVSHATAFRCQYGSLDFSDIKLLGNSKRAITEEDTVNAGGLIMFKVTHCSKIVATNNVISRQCFITYMGEEPSESNPNILEFNIKNCKSYDSYNCHLYNYCGVVNVENSDFGMCGGPVLIADHGRFADADGAEVLDVNNLVYKVNGYAPTSVFKNCTFNNYVAGTEAWFTQMGASGLVPDIKALSDLYAPYGMTYAVDQNHRPIIVSSASGDTISMFNFIALNKVSGESLSAVQSPACGSIRFINTEKGTDNTYNYAAPNKEAVDGAKEVMDALVAAQALPADQQASAAPGLIALANKYGVAYSQDCSDLVANLTTYCQQVGARELTTHASLRGANAAGGPVMQNGDAFVCYNQRTSDPTNTYFLQDISNVATWQTSSPNINPIGANHKFVTNRSAETALYYKGMMLVIGLNYLN